MKKHTPNFIQKVKALPDRPSLDPEPVPLSKRKSVLLQGLSLMSIEECQDMADQLLQEDSELAGFILEYIQDSQKAPKK